ncbi:mitochondrial ribosomal small subunit component [Malassezia japonica]|uniref:Small ribosomal subunit protein uS19m n=1 Tax=Malassezia japonica TaxID=223818 RepID=A0AAF0JAE5_9BASI|nr:mitochondrial ribosomal small subunit component [Malassezia japonica]WFD39388.1 mitochondrial ribosomal small subunit component [Malassezia japonica]
MLNSAVLLSRSAWKGPFFVPFPNLQQALKNNTPIRTNARSCTILPNFVGRLKFLVHNGKHHIPVSVTEEMVGHKLGEFASTRKRFSYRNEWRFPVGTVV